LVILEASAKIKMILEMKKVLFTLVIASVLFSAVIYSKETAILLSPVFLAFLYRLWFVKRFDEELLSNIKSIPALNNNKCRIPLNGDWEFKCDGCGWRSIKVPSDLSILNDGDWKAGKIFFRKTVSTPEIKSGQKMFLCSDGFNGIGKLSINGVIVENRIAGYFPFEVDVTDYLNCEELNIEIEVKYAATGHRAGCYSGLGPSFGIGLFNEIYLESGNSIRVTNVRMKEAGKALCIRLEGTADYPVAVSVAIESLDDNSVMFESKNITQPCDLYTELEFDVSECPVENWTIESPNLYRIRTKILSGDIASEHVYKTGISGFRFDQGFVRINSDRFVLMGIKRSPNYPPYGGAVPLWASKKDIAAIKETGLNTICTEEFIPDESFLSACDESGVAVISELPIKRIMDELPTEEAKILINNLTLRSIAHPSFIGWFIDESRNGHYYAKLDSILKDTVEESRVAIRENGYARQFKKIKDLFRMKEYYVDIYDDENQQKVIMNNKGSDTGLLSLEMIDSEGGKEHRKKRDLRKASTDLRYLKYVKEEGLGGLIVGQLNSWGIKQGVLSINRSKKADTEIVSAFIKSGIESAPEYLKFASQKSLRIIPFIAAVAVVALIITPISRRLFAVSPLEYGMFRNIWHVTVIKFLMIMATAFSLQSISEWKKGWIPGIARFMNYSLMIRLINNGILRTILIMLADIYLFSASVIIVGCYSHTGMNEVLMPLMMVSIFEVFFVIYSIGYINPILITIMVIFFQAMYLSWFFGIDIIVMFLSIKWLPWIAAMSFIKKRDIFAGR